MIKHRPITILIFLSFFITACSAGGIVPGQQTEPADLTHIRLPMGYIPNVQYAPFYVAKELGYFREAGLEIEFDYSFETDGVALVGANELPFAVVSGEQVLLARAQELPVVYVLGWWRDYPVAVSSIAGISLQEPSDLAGLRIGLPGLFGASYIGLRALLDAGGLEEQDVSLESIGFNQIEAMVAEQVDAAVIYANNEPIQLESMGYSVETLRVADYVSLASNGLISNEATIAQDPELVRRMTQALIKGIADTIANPEGAFSICKSYVEGLDGANQEVQMEILKASIEFWKAEDLGRSDPQSWENMQAVLLEMGLLSQPLDLSKAFTNQFIE